MTKTSETFSMPLDIFRVLTKSESMIFFALVNHPEGQSRDELKFFLYGRRLAENDSVSILLSRMKIKLKPKGYLIRNVGPVGLSCYQMRKVMVDEA